MCEQLCEFFFYLRFGNASVWDVEQDMGWTWRLWAVQPDDKKRIWEDDVYSHVKQLSDFVCCAKRCQEEVENIEAELEEGNFALDEVFQTKKKKKKKKNITLFIRNSVCVNVFVKYIWKV